VAAVFEVFKQVLALPPVARAARAYVTWLDFEKSGIIAALKRVAPVARGRLLDVGCGDRPYEPLFQPYVTEYIGVENEVTFGATAASERAKGPDVTYDGRRLPFDDGSFDTVMSIQVLEHTPRPAELVAEMARVLKDDGVLILSVPFNYRLHEEPHDYFRYTPHGLRELCGRAGLTVDQVIPRGGLWSLMGHQLNTYLAFRVARMGGVAQSMGGRGHEAPESAGARLWTLPFVAPTIACVGLGARVLDRVLEDPTDTLGFVVTARRAR
jgi:SAM-dependent methyltransferase